VPESVTLPVLLWVEVLVLPVEEVLPEVEVFEALFEALLEEAPEEPEEALSPPPPPPPQPVSTAAAAQGASIPPIYESVFPWYRDCFWMSIGISISHGSFRHARV